MVVGRSFDTSSACVGPDKATIFIFPCRLSLFNSFLITSVIVYNVSASIPLDTFTITCPSSIYSLAAFAVLRIKTDGTANIIMSFDSHAS